MLLLGELLEAYMLMSVDRSVQVGIHENDYNAQSSRAPSLFPAAAEEEEPCMFSTDAQLHVSDWRRITCIR